VGIWYFDFIRPLLIVFVEKLIQALRFIGGFDMLLMKMKQQVRFCELYMYILRIDERYNQYWRGDTPRHALVARAQSTHSRLPAHTIIVKIRNGDKQRTVLFGLQLEFIKRLLLRLCTNRFLSNSGMSLMGSMI